LGKGPRAAAFSGWHRVSSSFTVSRSPSNSILVPFVVLFVHRPHLLNSLHQTFTLMGSEHAFQQVVLVFGSCRF
jgi:hypothetical protein